MDPVTLTIVLGLATNYFTNFTTPVIENFFAEVFRRKPSLENDLKNATTPADLERIFREAVGVMDAAAGSGNIDVDGGFLTALRGIQFDHQHGKVTIQGTTLKAPVLFTGGKVGSTGTTHIGGSTSLRSRGTRTGQTHLNFAVGTPRRGVRGRPGGPSLPANCKTHRLIFNGLQQFRCVCPGNAH
jgi:hypothetical protein